MKDLPPSIAFQAAAPPFQLLYVGRFEERKGIDCLLAVLPDLVGQYPQLEIQLIGNDQLAWQNDIPLRQQFERDYPECLSQVHFLGEVSDAVLQQAYQDCDVFIAPSRYESFGLIYVEAMRAGKACIGTDIGGIPEVIADGVTGLLVPPDDNQALQSAIEYLLQHPEESIAMGKTARQYFEQKYSAEVFAQSIANTIALTVFASVNN
jgi:glycosyltransferase involved in cell wall biosynthesis